MKSLKYKLIESQLNERFAAGLVPSLAVYVKHPDYIGPMEYADKEGIMIISIKPGSTRNYELDSNGVNFETSFRGVSTYLSIPLGSICAVYTESDPDMYFSLGVDLEVKEVVEEVGFRNDKAHVGWVPRIV